MKHTGQDVIRLFRLLEDSGVAAWLDGGWGIDALLKKETRAHRDVDLIVPLDDLANAESVLAKAGFTRDDSETNLPTRLVLRNCDGLEIDIHPVIFRPDGSAVHIDEEAGGGAKYTYVYSSAGLSGVGMIGGRVVRCTTATEQIRQKVERRFSPWSETRIRGSVISTDLEDISSVLQVFGAEEGGHTQPGVSPKAQQAGNTVVEAAKQFSLRHVTALNAQHSRLTAQHAKLSAEHAELGAQLAELGAQHAELNAQHSRLTVQHAKLMAQINAIWASTSWQLTAPLRWTVTRLGMHWLKPRAQ